MTDSKTPVGALEKMQLTSFIRDFSLYRASQIPSHYIDLTDPKLQLPNMSTLHQITGFLNLEELIATFTPDLTSPFITHEVWRKYLTACFDVSDTDAQPFPVDERYTFRIGRMRSQFVNFVNEEKSVHRVISERSVEAYKDALIICDYAPLKAVYLQNTRFASYRKFDLIFRTLLNKVLQSSPQRSQFIHIPLSDRAYSRSQYRFGFSRLDTLNVNRYNDPSFFFLIHLLGMAYGPHHKTTVTPYPSDVAYAQSHNKELPELVSTSLLARIPTTAARRIYFILTHGANAAIYNLADLQQYSERADFFDKLYRHVSTLSLMSVGQQTESQLNALSDKEFDDHIEEKTTPQESSRPTQVIPEGGKTLSQVTKELETASDKKETPKPNVITPQKTEVKVDPFTAPKAVQTTQTKESVDQITTPQEAATGTPPTATQAKATLTPILDTPALITPSPAKAFQDSVYDDMKTVLEKHKDDPAAQKRIATLYEKHLNAKIAGRPIGELISEDVIPKMKPASISAIEHLVPEKEMIHSSLINFDQDYVKHVLHRDVAKVLSSFVRHGMFITDIKESKVRDRFNRIDRYSVRYIDASGKQHTIPFALPHVDENGEFLINGVKSRQIKQQVNLPITKIDDYRVSISTNFNKALLVRTQLKAHRFDVYVREYLGALIKAGLISYKSGSIPPGREALPFEYSTLALHYLELDCSQYTFTFDYPTRFNLLEESLGKKAEKLEKEYGVFCGTTPDGSLMFWDMYDRLHAVTREGKHKGSTVHFMEFLRALYGDKISPQNVPAEFVQLELQGGDFPVVFVLGFENGLTQTLKDIGLDYRSVKPDEKVALRVDEMRIDFQDQSLIFSRYPLKKSLVAAGLAWIDTKHYALSEFDSEDVYYRVLDEKGESRNYLKGVGSFFALFDDPITVDVLKENHQPTSVKEILLKGVDLLSTLDHHPASEMRHHRMRGYERLPGMLYNELSRSYAVYRTQKSHKKTFSINPEAVFQRIMTDSATQTVETINPIHDIKSKSQLTYSGSGGRTSRAFVLGDRVFPKDGVGILSEASPDSGKVGLTSYLTANPLIKNLRGVYNPIEGEEKLHPSQMLSVVANLMPGVTQDD
mgnify:CR=1 FL=1